MAWLDDRAWCHAKFTDLTDKAYRAYWNGVAYSSGMGTKGVLTAGQQALVGSTAKVRAELVNAALWEPDGDTVRIHDWDDHNGKRDARKQAAKERMRALRAQKRAQNSYANGSEQRSESVPPMKEVKEVTTPKAPSHAPGPPRRPERAYIDPSVVCAECGATRGEGCRETCSRLARPTVALVVASEPERVEPPQELAAMLGRPSAA